MHKKYSNKIFRYSRKLLLLIFNISFFPKIKQKKKHEIIKIKYLFFFVLLRQQNLYTRDLISCYWILVFINLLSTLIII